MANWRILLFIKKILRDSKSFVTFLLKHNFFAPNAQKGITNSFFLFNMIEGEFSHSVLAREKRKNTYHSNGDKKLNKTKCGGIFGQIASG